MITFLIGFFVVLGILYLGYLIISFIWDLFMTML